VVALIGADGIASDAREAVEQAEKLVALRQGTSRNLPNRCRQ
jgi:hypothetical protein